MRMMLQFQSNIGNENDVTITSFKKPSNGNNITVTGSVILF
jgi:hypothetical protein